MDSRNNLITIGSRVSGFTFLVDKDFVENAARKIARDKLEEDAEWKDVVKLADKLIEEPSEETELDVMRLAVENIPKSKFECVRSESSYDMRCIMEDILDELKKIHMMAQQENNVNSRFNVVIKPEEDIWGCIGDNPCDNPYEKIRLDIYANGECIRGNLSIYDANVFVTAMIAGAKMQSTVSINTSAGELRAGILPSIEAPAVWISFIPAGKSYEIDMALAECKESDELWTEDETNKDVSLYIYENPDTDEWTRKVIYKREDVLFDE